MLLVEGVCVDSNVVNTPPGGQMLRLFLLSLVFAVTGVLACTGDAERSTPVSEAQTSSEGSNAANPPNPVEQWRFAVPDRYDVRVAANDNVVIASAGPRYPEYNPEERFVVALERDTGTVRWRATLPCKPLYPAVDGDRAYLPCNDGFLRAWNLADGAEAWSIDTRGAPVFALPAGKLLLVADGDPEDYDFDDMQLAHLPDGRVRAYQSATGELRYELPLERVTAFLVLHENVLYVATEDRQAQGETLAVKPATGEVIWRTATGPASSRPFVTKDAVFVAAETGELRRLSAHDGREEWSRSVPGGGVFESPVVVDDVVVAGTNVNVLYRLNATDGSILSRGAFCDCPYEGTTLEGLVLTAGPWIALLDPASLGVVWQYQARGGMWMPAIADGWIFAPSPAMVLAFRYR